LTMGIRLPNLDDEPTSVTEAVLASTIFDPATPMQPVQQTDTQFPHDLDPTDIPTVI
jgi:hypothetical protein